MYFTYYYRSVYLFVCVEVAAASYGIMYNMAFSDLRVDPSSKGIVSSKVSHACVASILWDTVYCRGGKVSRFS